MNELIEEPEVKLWRGVVVQAVRDAMIDNANLQAGTESIYNWTKTVDCKEVCRNAQLDHDNVRIGFAEIYIKFLWKQYIAKKRELISNNISVKAAEALLKPLKSKIDKAKRRKERIQCKTW